MVKLILSCGGLLVCVSMLAGCESLAASDQAMSDAQYKTAVERFNAQTWSNELDAMTF